MHEGGWKAGNHDEHGIPEDMAVKHLVAAATLGARSQYILLADFLEKRVFGKQGHRRKCRQRHRKNWQRQVPEIVEDFLPPWQLRPALRHQSAQRKPIEERAPGEQDDQQNCEKEPGNGVADDNDARGPDVETGAVTYGLSDAKRNRNQICKQRHPDSERHRYGQFLLDQLHHADVAEVAFSEVEAHVVPDHQRKTLIGRLVETELLFKSLDELRVEALRATVLGVH